MAKQTAVEWLVNEINKMNVSREATLFINKLKDQAKQMEKKQSKQDYDAGLFDGTMDDVKDRLYKNAEQYYNETYGQQQ